MNKVLKRALNTSALFLTAVSLAMMLVGFFWPYWLQWDDPNVVSGFVGSDTIRWGLFNREIKYTINDDEFIVHTDINDIPTSQQSLINDYETAADVAVILGIIAMALTCATLFLSLALLIVGNHLLAWTTTITCVLAFLMSIVTWAYWQGERPKGGNGDWEEYRVYASFGLWVASSGCLGIASVLFSLGGSAGSFSPFKNRNAY